MSRCRVTSKGKVRRDVSVVGETAEKRVSFT
jgi:hypothetical protein